MYGLAAFATWWTTSPIDDTAFDTQIMTLMQTVNLFSSAVFVFIMQKKWFLRASKIGSVIKGFYRIVGFAPYLPKRSYIL